jgi:AcrR family transcriptional regulator
LPPLTKAVLEPRKSPVQARSTASVEAILEATLQVLLECGKEKLTTTKVAYRAGVSVGTLYQYFPNKSALLQAVLTRHLDEVTSAVESACHQQKGCPLQQMANALMNAFLAAKMKNGKISGALYAVSSDVDGARIAKERGFKSVKVIAAMLASAPEQLADPQLAATMLYGVMVGVSRNLLESPHPEKQLEPLRQELIFVACAYLKASSSPRIA